MESDLQHTQRDLATAQKQVQQITLEMDGQKEKLARLEQDAASEKRHTAELKDVIKATGKKNDQLTQQLEEERQALIHIKQTEADLRIEGATLKERAAHIDDLKEQVGMLQGQLAGLAKPRQVSKKT
ncbi:MAG: hypothetical protein GY792_07100 [Gammaproteobacteria bacterium]|nr:hypothetical protein [Gammaproteobacteria bacterium]